jgi:hypothetical protein
MKSSPAFFFAILMALFFYSCSDSKTDLNQKDTTSSQPTTTNTTENDAVDGIIDASGKITAAVVDKACNCQAKGIQEDGNLDISAIIDCMGGKNKIQFVQELLGTEATEKERSDAEKVLTEKMNSKCPM